MRATDFAVEGNTPSKPGSKGVPLTWKLVCVGITVLALFFVFRKIPLDTLLNTLRDMKVGWFIAAIALYGAMFFPAAWRLHIALRINDCAANLPASFRFSLIGHFFYLILFGGTAGDAAKAAVYGRRYQKPLPSLLASVWLDRLMGSGALLTITASAFLVAALHGGLDGSKSFSIRSSAWWLLLLIPALVLALFFVKRSRHESILRHCALTFLEGGRRLIKSPRKFLSGFGCSLLMQLAVNAAIASNLQAVSHTPIPWARLAWTFPVIMVVSGLPITFAGIGARDGAAIALLGACGISAADAEAMALLTLCTTAFWGLVGGILLWIETTKATERREPTAQLSEQPL